MGAIKESFHDTLRLSDRELMLVPTSVEEAYERILSRVDSTQRKYAKALLTIIVSARRPLSIKKMALALDIATLPEAPSSLADLTVDTKHLSDSIQRWCGLFVRISGGRLYPLRQTTKEFLLSPYGEIVLDHMNWKHCLPALEVEKDLVTICIQCSCLPEFNCCQQEKAAGQDEERLGVETFFRFAATLWVSYVQHVEELLDNQTWARMVTLYESSSERWRRWTLDISKDLGMGPIHIAAYSGYVRLLRTLPCLCPHGVDSEDARSITSLSWAAQQGHVKALQILLDACAEINTEKATYDDALYTASDSGNEQAVWLLLEAGADPNGASCTSAWTDTLLVAAINGHEEMLRTLVNAGANIEAQCIASNALYVASTFRHEKIEHMLLDASANPNAQGAFGNALHYASLTGCENIVELLRRFGANERQGPVGVHLGSFKEIGSTGAKHAYYCLSGLQAWRRCHIRLPGEQVLGSGCSGGQDVEEPVQSSTKTSPLIQKHKVTLVLVCTAQ